MRENTALVNGTPTAPIELVKELRDATKTLNVRQRLAGWARALKHVRRKDVGGFNWLLLVLNLADNTIRVTGFNDRPKAAKTLEQLEKREGEGNVDAVLVWVPSAKELKAAYPNYYADATEFIAALNAVIKV